MMTMKRILLLVLSAIVAMCAVNAQESHASYDSLPVQNDSVVQALQNQIRELKMQGILMQEQLEATGKSIREDSLRVARRKARIDSLRMFMPGVPLIVDGDTLFRLYNRKGGMQPEARVKEIATEILAAGKSMKLIPDSVYVFEGDYTTDIMSGSRVIISLTDNDALWQNSTRQLLGAEYKVIIEGKINQLHAKYGLQQKVKGVLYVVAIIGVMSLLIWCTNWCYRRWRFRVVRSLLRRSRHITVKDYELLNLHRMGVLFMTAFNVMRVLIILLLLFICIPMVFVVFPETKSLTYTIFGYVWNPLTGIVRSVVGFLPDLIQIIIIVLCFRYLVKGLHYLMNEIGSGRLKLSGFYPDWAQPTYYILRLLCYSFMLVMIWPLLPNSNSEVFQGVSVFIGIIVSLGSSSIIGNVMAGMVMTYMRPFRVGDFIKYGDTEGFVLEKTVLVTRIRTRKNNVITVPNSNLLGAQTTNFTSSAQDYGIIVHTKVTIGYDMPWQKIRQLLLDAAHKTKNLRLSPEPFVLITALDDFYVEYELNAYTKDYQQLPFIYSDLHHNILDVFHSNGVEIMSPHIYAHRSDLELQIPKENQ